LVTTARSGGLVQRDWQLYEARIRGLNFPTHAAYERHPFSHFRNPPEPAERAS